MRYRQSLGARVCDGLATGEALEAICQRPGMPPLPEVLAWLADPRRADFQAAVAKAREARADALVGEILSIADDPTGAEQVQRSKLRVDTRRWLAAKLAPAKYGDASSLEISGPAGGPITVDRPERLTREAWLARRVGGLEALPQTEPDEAPQ
jgi:hypothetical protein